MLMAVIILVMGRDLGLRDDSALAIDVMLGGLQLVLIGGFAHLHRFYSLFQGLVIFQRHNLERTVRAHRQGISLGPAVQQQP